jgi:hypothetical protein
MSALERGAVVDYLAIFAFESSPRPYLIASGGAHPFHGEEYVGLAITTTDLDPAMLIDDAWVHGSLPKRSFIKPWQPTLLKHDDIVDAFGLLRLSVVNGETDPAGVADALDLSLANVYEALAYYYNTPEEMRSHRRDQADARDELRDRTVTPPVEPDGTP